MTCSQFGAIPDRAEQDVDDLFTPLGHVASLRHDQDIAFFPPEDGVRGKEHLGHILTGNEDRTLLEDVALLDVVVFNDPVPGVSCRIHDVSTFTAPSGLPREESADCAPRARESRGSYPTAVAVVFR